MKSDFASVRKALQEQQTPIQLPTIKQPTTPVHLIDTDVLKRAQGYAVKLTGRNDIVFSDEQLVVFQAAAKGTGSIILQAYAGTGKTFTGLIAGLLMGKNIAYIVFGNAAGAELQAKLNQIGIEYKVANAKTCHSLGFGGLKKVYGEKVDKHGRPLKYPTLEVDRDKVKKILDDKFIGERTGYQVHHKPFKDNKLAQEFSGIICKLVSYAQQRIIGVKGNIDDTKLWFDIVDHYNVIDMQEGVENCILDVIKIAIEVLKINNEIVKVVSFDDMIYLALLKKVPFWKNDVVIMDEAQDANDARMALANVALAHTTREGLRGRFMAMGDNFQSIMGFTGAPNDAMDRLKRLFNCKELKLTMTRRCSHAAVRMAQKYVPDYKAHPSNKEGAEIHCNEDEVITAYREFLVDGSAILCRNTAPLVDFAFKCLRHQIACTVEGRKTIGAQLIELAQRWKTIKTINALEQKLETFLQHQRTRFLAQEKNDALGALEDKVESLLVVIDECRKRKLHNVSDVVTYLNKIFEDTIDEDGKIIKKGFKAMTGHRSKGLEFDNVFLLGMNRYNPSPYAKLPWMEEQEDHLCYVMVTRTRDRNIVINVPLPQKGA